MGLNDGLNYEDLTFLEFSRDFYANTKSTGEKVKNTYSYAGKLKPGCGETNIWTHGKSPLQLYSNAVTLASIWD